MALFINFNNIKIPHPYDGVITKHSFINPLKACNFKMNNYDELAANNRGGSLRD